MRRRGRVDSVQEAIVAALRATGCSVQSLATVGGGCPDLLVGLHGRNFLLEVKAKVGKLTPMQRDWIAAWAGQTFLVRDVDDALYALGRIARVVPGVNLPLGDGS